MGLSMYHRSIFGGLASVINESGDFRPIDYLGGTAFAAEQNLVKALVPLIAGDLHALVTAFVAVQDCQAFLFPGYAQRLFGFVCKYLLTEFWSKSVNVNFAACLAAPGRLNGEPYEYVPSSPRFPHVTVPPMPRSSPATPGPGPSSKAKGKRKVSVDSDIVSIGPVPDTPSTASPSKTGFGGSAKKIMKRRADEALKRAKTMDLAKYERTLGKVEFVSREEATVGRPTVPANTNEILVSHLGGV